MTLKFSLTGTLYANELDERIYATDDTIYRSDETRCKRDVIVD